MSPVINGDEDPQWFKDAVIYQLHIKSFFDSNGDGVGDVPGVIAKLDYLAELGVTAIWLLPFYPSPRRDDGYDIAEYRGVHPEYGTLADLRMLVEAAHARGLRVISELVINHTSDQHEWFQRARRAPIGSDERNFYVWSDDDRKYADTRIIFIDTEKSNWTWDEVAGAYYWHRFYAHQPDLNFDHPPLIEEVMSIMRFWLDIGVDGLRLDAVPYLVEREGTINENLPETHSILKRLRAEMDAHAPGRMLLAEANQWPEDAQQYFGAGDECHMCFHFPLMPRMYMAIAREDRFPITDIMRQTPDIPENCQWAIFLRNHDELTLEMVTDSERDYLWETYATDRRARLNLGIRRRLAPLLERDRRRIELMNALLLSMPGTPIIYYGDEIGMGDNIHLGDRDGVRTPMQWSIDRNGGFSRADPASLVLPPIMDPLYGFQAVNVEAQERDPHSLLTWTKRMLAVRRRFTAFGRGTLRFLYPANRKTLAYFREYTAPDGSEETILCVCNMSRAAQAVELDLSAYRGRVPLDIVGGSAFPPVRAENYTLTLPPYGVFWFMLAAEAHLPSWYVRPPEPLPEYHTFVLRGDVAEVTQQPSRAVLEREVLPAYLAKRRWFASKSERIEAVEIAYAQQVAGTRDMVMMEIVVKLPGRQEQYVLPLAAAWEDDNSAGGLALQLALARVRRGRRVGVLTDAFAADALVQVALRRLHSGGRVPLTQGALEFRPTKLMDTLALPDRPEVRRLAAEQSNSSLIVEDAIVMKMVRRVSAGVHPEAEITRVLTERGFANTAPLFGDVVRVEPDGTPHTLMIVQGFVRNQGDGWGWTLDYLNRIAEDATVGEAASAGADGDVFDEYTIFAANLGRRLGELHAVLSQESDDPAFAPVEADAAILEEWVEGAQAQLAMALRLLRGRSEWPDQRTEALADRLLGQETALQAEVARLGQRGRGALSTRVHGDFHLGQVLVVQGDAFIIDFEGEPARTLEQRRAKSSPMRDVAGLLRSFDYAAAAVAPGRTANSPRAEGRRLSLLARFEATAARTFLDAYRAVLEVAPRAWASQASEQPLLDLFLIEKAAYEVRYEAENRPTWLSIPLEGLSAIADRVLSQELVS